MQPSASQHDQSDAAAPTIVVGIVASPGPASELVGDMEAELSERMTSRVPDVSWRFRFTSDSLVAPPTDVTELISAGRRRMLRDGWDLAVLVTDLPIETARRPVIAHASTTHAVAVLSMPALGAVGVRRRLAETVTRLTAALVGDVRAHPVDEQGTVDRSGPPTTVVRRVRELGHRVETDDHGLLMVARVAAGNLRLLMGMLRANRPWQLSIRLTRASVAALGAATLALVTSDIWRLADSLGPVHLSLITVASTTATACTLIIGAQLWERSPQPRAREQVALFNIVTMATVGIGVLSLYLSLLALTWIGSLLLVPGPLLSAELGHPVGIGDQWELAWLASSLATIGEALGAGLESDEAVREAAYTYRKDEPSHLPAKSAESRQTD